MPALSRLFLRTALLYLIAGFTAGALLLANKGMPFYPLIWRLRTGHIEALLIGWTLQFIMGIGYWILPRWRSRRGRVGWAVLAYVLLNMGTLAIVYTSLMPRLQDGALIAGRVAEAGGGVAFVIHAWPRVKAWGHGFRK